MVDICTSFSSTHPSAWQHFAVIPYRSRPHSPTIWTLIQTIHPSPVQSGTCFHTFPFSFSF